MPRGSAVFNQEAAKPEVAPVLLVRVLNIPDIATPTIRQSLYLTDCEVDTLWYGEGGAPKVYMSCGLTYSSVNRSTKNEIDSCTLRIDNVNLAFTALAQHAELNGVEVHVLRGFRNTLHSPDGAQYVFAGKIKACRIGQTSFDATVTTGFSLSTRVPRRIYWPMEFPHIPSSKDPANVFTRPS
jgi:hypothetical protein